MLRFLPLTSSYVISPITLRSPATYRSLATYRSFWKVEIPVKVETPTVRSVTLPTSAWRVVRIPELMVAIPLTTKFSVDTELSSIPVPPSTLISVTSSFVIVATPIAASVISA